MHIRIGGSCWVCTRTSVKERDGFVQRTRACERSRRDERVERGGDGDEAQRRDDNDTDAVRLKLVLGKERHHAEVPEGRGHQERRREDHKDVADDLRRRVPQQLLDGNADGRDGQRRPEPREVRPLIGWARTVRRARNWRARSAAHAERGHDTGRLDARTKVVAGRAAGRGQTIEAAVCKTLAGNSRA